jgi:cytochrome c-type biogenesis protein CcmH
MRRLAALVCAAGLLVGSGAPALSAVDVIGLERELKCPTCNVPLDVSTASSAQRMKDYIRQRADEGWSEQRIKDSLVAQFGRSVLATPPKEGFDLVAWVVPGLAVAGGLIAVPFLIRAWGRRGAKPAPAGADASPEERERLQRELDRFQG